VTLRIIDAGDVGAVRSQSLWHGVASAMTPDTPPTLSFCRPLEPYVCQGYHRPLAELDLDACRGAGIRVLRRQLGGGPVYIDRDQLFFQLTVPAHRAPLAVRRLYREFLAPAVAAFRTMGLDARLSGPNDIAVSDRKISGTAAGRIGDGVTVVGNVIFRFPHERMVRTLSFPTPDMRHECLRLMQRHVTSLARTDAAGISVDAARRALVAAYARALGARAEPVAPSSVETRAIELWDDRMTDPEWIEGPASGAGPVRQVKISADVWVTAAAGRGMFVEVSVAGGTIDRVSIRDETMNGETQRMAAAVAGAPADLTEIRRRLEPFHNDGRRALELIRPGLELTC